MTTAVPLLEGETDSMSARIVEEIGAILGRRRMSQSALARALDRSPVWVSERLTGKTRISVDDLALIAAALKVHMVDLLPRTEREPVTLRERDDRRDAMSLVPAPAPRSPYSGLRGPLPNKMTLGTLTRPNSTRTADGRPSLVHPRGI